MRHDTDFSSIFPVAPGTSRWLYGRGFTLVEMIISIVITGIVVSMVAIFGRNQINAYMDVGNRAELSDAADTTLRRVARDLQSALPNSVRVSGNFLEFVPIHDAGRYRAELNSTGGGDMLNFGSSTDTTFDVLGPSVTILAGDELVIFNLGQPGSDVYEQAPRTSRRAITTPPGTVSSIRYALEAPPNQQFPLTSPQNRFQIVGTPVTYECTPTALVRHSGYGFIAAQPVAFGSLGGVPAIMADNVGNADGLGCTFNYTPAILQRNGLVVLRLKLTRNGESVELLHQVDVLNTP